MHNARRVVYTLQLAHSLILLNSATSSLHVLFCYIFLCILITISVFLISYSFLLFTNYNIFIWLVFFSDSHFTKNVSSCSNPFISPKRYQLLCFFFFTSLPLVLQDFKCRLFYYSGWYIYACFYPKLLSDFKGVLKKAAQFYSYTSSPVRWLSDGTKTR